MKYLDKFHILYTDRNGNFQSVEKHFDTINKAEEWLKEIGAKYWEIGIIDLTS